MILSMSDQAMIFLMAVLIGFVIGFVYDLFRILRKIIKHPNFLIQLEDIIYWIFVSIIMFYVMLDKNHGEIRAFSILGAFIGMILYFLTVSHLFINVSMAIIGFLKKVASEIIRITLTPFKLIYKLFSPPIKKFILIIKKVLHKFKKHAIMKSAKVFGELKIITKKV